jgi:hypothetical protein
MDSKHRIGRKCLSQIAPKVSMTMRTLRRLEIFHIHGIHVKARHVNMLYFTFAVSQTILDFIYFYFNASVIYLSI